MRNAGPSGEQADIRKESLLFPDSLYCLYCGAKLAPNHRKPAQNVYDLRSAAIIAAREQCADP